MVFNFCRQRLCYVSATLRLSLRSLAQAISAWSAAVVFGKINVTSETGIRKAESKVTDHNLFGGLCPIFEGPMGVMLWETVMR